MSTVKGGCPLLGNLPPSRYPISLLVVTIQNTAQILHPMAVFFPTHSANHIVKGSPWCAFSKLQSRTWFLPIGSGRKKQLNKHLRGDSELRVQNLSVYIMPLLGISFGNIGQLKSFIYFYYQSFTYVVKSLLVFILNFLGCQ